MWKEQKRILDKMYRQFGTFKVASNSGCIWQYFDYKSRDSLIDLKRDQLTDRKIMPDEIIIESDLPLLQMNRGVAKLHKKKLIKNGIAFEEWYSGNKSFHIQCIFPELRKISNDARKNLKKSFLLWLYNYNEDNLFKHKIDISLCSNHLIRLEFSKHPDTKNRKVLRDDHEVDRDNKLPTIVWLHYINKNVNKSRVRLKSKSVFNKQCIMLFLNTPISDCRHRMAFVLFNQFKREFGVIKAEQVLREWNTTMYNNHISDQWINGLVRLGSKHYKVPGCKYTKDLLKELGVSKKVCTQCPY